MTYIGAFLTALLKDLLDFTLIGSLPGIGTIITICFSLLILFFLVLAGASRKSYNLTKKGLLLLLGTGAEGLLFGLNFLPIETLTVYAIYRMDKKQRQQKEERKQQERKLKNAAAAY
jgi:Zn-dependent membrane protease YugP